MRRGDREIALYRGGCQRTIDATMRTALRFGVPQNTIRVRARVSIAGLLNKTKPAGLAIQIGREGLHTRKRGITTPIPGGGHARGQGGLVLRFRKA